MEAFIGTILPWPLSWAPEGWFLCQGQQVPIAQYQALYSVLGFTYGGDQGTTFGIPDLRSRLPLGAGAGPELTTRNLAQTGGSETVPMTLGNLPAHTHPGLQLSKEQGNSTSPNGNYIANSYYPGDVNSGSESAMLASYVTPANAGTLETVTVGSTGGGQPLATMPPFLVLNYIICWQGLYPMRP